MRKVFEDPVVRAARSATAGITSASITGILASADTQAAALETGASARYFDSR